VTGKLALTRRTISSSALRRKRTTALAADDGRETTTTNSLSVSTGHSRSPELLILIVCHIHRLLHLALQGARVIGSGVGAVSFHHHVVDTTIYQKTTTRLVLRRHHHLALPIVKPIGSGADSGVTLHHVLDMKMKTTWTSVSISVNQRSFLRSGYEVEPGQLLVTIRSFRAIESQGSHHQRDIRLRLSGDRLLSLDDLVGCLGMHHLAVAGCLTQKP
jgi:hypothetical protein